VIEAVFVRHGPAIRSFAIRGHADLAPRGEDVVCAAVSALAQGILIGLEEVVRIPVDVDVRDGWLRCTLRSHPEGERGGQAQVLLRTLLLSLRSIEEGYGDALQVREIVREEEGDDGEV
jgi:uncharacterized protein YsxB (DUF464 family)